MNFLLRFLKFGAVGGFGVLINMGVYNLLLATVWSSHRAQLGTIYASIVATICAIATNWVGARYWAFRENRREDQGREMAEFVAVSLAGMLIPLGCLWVTHYLMGYQSHLADFISNNIIGLGIGTVFRFALYHWWVYSPSRTGAVPKE